MGDGIAERGPRKAGQPACSGAERRGFLEETPASGSLKPRQEAGAEVEDGEDDSGRGVPADTRWCLN